MSAVGIGKDDIESISSSIIDRLKSDFSIKSDTHRMHHEYIQAQIDCQKNRSLFYSRMIESLATWGCMAILGFFFMAAYEYVKCNLR
jgi:hypothetical protein